MEEARLVACDNFDTLWCYICTLTRIPQGVEEQMWTLLREMLSLPVDEE
jgi:hypothetical protein